MKPLFLTLLAVVLSATWACGDEQARDVQGVLKDQGFYFGDITGQETKEYHSAIKRYQIRNGLQATGEVSDELLQSLGLAGAPAAPPEPAPEPAPRPSTPQVEPAPAAPPPVNLRREETIEQSDQRALRDETRRTTRDPSVLPPPAPLGEPFDAPGDARPDPRYAEVFAGSPYRSAPQVVQGQTLKRAQQILAQRGLYRQAIDGLPGPATEEAILSYQRLARLPLSGRLDVETLNALRLLPGRGPGNPPMKPFSQGQTRPGMTGRRIWVE